MRNQVLTFAVAFVTMSALDISRAQAETYTYDASGRLTGATYDDGSTLTYTYDAAGNIVQRQAVLADTTPPVIVLLGDNPMTVEQDATFSDPGATVTDDVDTGLTATVAGSVDTTIVATYSLNYNASDVAGNAAVEVIRTVEVVAGATPPGDSGCGCVGTRAGGSSRMAASLLFLVGLVRLISHRRRRRL